MYSTGYECFIESGNMVIEEDGVKYPIKLGYFQGKRTTYFQRYDLKATSDKGLYDITIESTNYASIIFSTVFPEKENILTAEEIKALDIQIIGTNRATGAVRIMNQSTIEGITIFAFPGGQVTSISIRGRAQVGVGGKLDRYTAEADYVYWN